MTGHDERKWILPKRLRDIARQIAIAEPLGDLAIGQCRTGANAACDIVDATIKVGDTLAIDRDVAEPLASPRSNAPMSSMARCTASGGAASCAVGKRRRTWLRVARSLLAGSCTPATPRPLQTMPQQPIAVLKTAKASSLMPAPI